MKKVTLYTLSTCPWCRKAKKFFTDRNIPFTDTDYDVADEATQGKILKELDAAGATGFPYAKSETKSSWDISRNGIRMRWNREEVLDGN